ncbi:MAG: RHS repeat-associated core domain-containing protein, partial [Bacteroidales bacterium]|nr:RHS repeat-associated core domain-containing protein [Bacteroidales bacterium]
KMEVKQNGSVILTRWYLGSNYIKETSSGVTKEYTFIGGNAYTAPAVSIRQSGVSTTYYLLRDHLGSITHVVNASTGSTTYEYSYDAWGRMRNTTNWTNYSPGSEPALFIAGRGFTGHEHLPWFNLINMNGRVYDPLTGQFLNVDNNLQSPDFTQNFNRYAYCLNNPLVYTDPDGEWIFTILASFFCPALLPVAIAADIGGIVNVGTHINSINNFGQFAGYYGIGAAAGAAGAGVGLGIGSALAGGSFLGGVIGTSTKVATGFFSGLASGAAGGFTGGFINGFGNTAMDPLSDFGNMLSAGWNSGLTGAIFGGVAGGITGGIDAITHERNFFSGELKPRQDVLVRISDGKLAFNGEEIIPKENYKYFDTPLSNNSNVTALNNTDQLTIKYPKGVKITGLRQYGDNYIQNVQLGKHSLTILATDNASSTLLYGYRYYKNPPLSSFRDLFHFRPR